MRHFKLSHVRTALVCLLAAGFCAASARAVAAGTSFDGAWDLVFVTRAGNCDPSTNFTVNVSRGNVTHPNLLKFSGRVTNTGAVRASVTAGDKFAAGTGQLSGASGGGSWSGHSGMDRCSGYWTARKN